MRLRDKVAIITGAGTGIGEAIAHKFAREGARLVVSGLPADPVQDVAEAIASAGGQVQPHFGDLAEELAARTCVQLALQSFGALDVLVSNAGIFIANAETDAYRIEDFDRTIRNNVRTAFLMTKFALPHLQTSRVNIVFTGSKAGLNGSPSFTPYGGSKGFLHAFPPLMVALENLTSRCAAIALPTSILWSRLKEAAVIPDFLKRPARQFQEFEEGPR